LISLPTATKIFNWLSTYLGNPPLLRGYKRWAPINWSLVSEFSSVKRLWHDGVTRSTFV
jgi:heme/copper-type cytochrome/quinol oxidase subunit 1